MNLPVDLLEQAEYLAGRETRRPRQASLRRAVSAAYYAVFHLLIHEACGRLVAGSGLRNLTACAFNHGDMKKACQVFLRTPLPVYLVPVVGSGVPADIQLIAEFFTRLQAARHDADYSPDRRFTRSETRKLVQQARDAFAAWERVKRDPTADAFLVGLLLGDRWNR
ncbi:MAG: hypothetical protein U0804_05585 [Gemmataceae bacterium]